MSDIAEVYYQSQTPAPVGVWRVGPEDLSQETAHQVLEVMTAAYAYEFEGPYTEAMLPPGTVRAHFRPDDAAGVQRQLDRMEGSAAKGGEYWLAALTEGLGAQSVRAAEAIGVLHYSPSYATDAQRDGRADPNLYLNDIAVGSRRDSPDSAPVRRRGIGIDLMHVLTRHAGYSPEAALVLDSLDESRARDWFKQMGLHRRLLSRVPPLIIGEYGLRQTRMGTGRRDNLGSVATRLEQRHRRLLEAQVAFSDMPE